MHPRSGWLWMVVVGSGMVRVKYSGGWSNTDAELFFDADFE